MMEGNSLDLSGAVDMLKNMLSNDEGQQQIQNIIGMFGGDNPENSQSPGQATGGIDPDNIEMFLKLQQAMTVMNSDKNNNQSRLLTALKPFLKPSRRQKVDNAMRLLQLTKVMEVMKNVQGD